MFEELKQFLIKAKSQGYAAGDESVSTEESNKSKSTHFSDGDYSFNDNWFGGEPFGGREVVWENNKPLWMVVYYGSDSGKAPELIPFLMKCLSKIPNNMPAREPKDFIDGDFTYKNE